MKSIGAAILGILCFCGVSKSAEQTTQPIDSIIIYDSRTEKVFHFGAARYTRIGDKIFIVVSEDEPEDPDEPDNPKPPDKPEPPDEPEKPTFLEKKSKDLAQGVQDDQKSETSEAIALLFESSAKLEEQLEKKEDLKKGLDFLYDMTLAAIDKTELWKNWKTEIDKFIDPKDYDDISKLAIAYREVAKGLKQVEGGVQ